MSLPDTSHRAEFIKHQAVRLGFLGCGISRADILEEEAPRLEKWLQSGMHGSMSYMENHFDKRLDPRKLVPGAGSVISLTFNYYTDQRQHDPDAPKISQYAYGTDYHFVIKDKLKELLHEMRTEFGDVDGRIFVDSAPVLDKAWAMRSGLGWMGKNTNVIHPKEGSFFFIAEIICDLDLQADTPMSDYCGTCTRCIDACPTNAIIEPYVVDGSKCISHFTIELKGALPGGYADQFDNWMFGCDVCQDVCPWNRFSKPHNEPAFDPHPSLLSMGKSEWQELTRETFNEIFKKSAVKRTKYEGLKRNIAYLFDSERLD
ncbi:MAG: tRNA epoxyqueuosine(34) reductase QueG [Flavobacteriales bacterium]|nr:tRNA epoxyqueuosine(34) reductase QueG [Flavobacteriales bacterium]